MGVVVNIVKNEELTLVVCLQIGLLCAWMWLTAFIIRRVCDKVLGGCWFVLCVIQGSFESVENYRENSTLLGAHNVSSRVSKESSGTSRSVSELH